MDATDLVGWAATAAFALSYFLPETRMRVVQMLGAALWLAYGLLLGEPPIIVANSLVLVAAFFTTRRKRGSGEAAVG
ncbi:MAG TPA: YgjV family protein [Longimicrobiales bacterium]